MGKCTKCDIELNTFDYCGIKFEICQKCGAVFINQENFNKLSQKIDKTLKPVDLFSIPSTVSGEETRKCPLCSINMEKILYNGVLIDRCPECKCLFFDNGELSKYYSKISKKNIEIMNNALLLKTYCSNTNSSNNKSVSENKNKNSSGYERETVMQIQSKEKEKTYQTTDGFFMLVIITIAALLNIVLYLCMVMLPGIVIIAGILTAVILFCLRGFITVKPQEAYVLTLFGNYVGTIRNSGFFWKNPFISTNLGGMVSLSLDSGNIKCGIPASPISLKARTLDNGKLKINDEDGNPIEVGIMVTWEVKDTAMAVFNVDDYVSFLSAQCDSVLRRIIRQYPYDAPENSGKETLRGDSAEISEKLKIEIQNAVIQAGLHIIDARITHLAYSSEIAAAMLQRQQANAIIAAKCAIVDGAVDMVEMALEKLSHSENLKLDDEAKAKMVNNLLVVLCGNKDSQPVIQL